MPDTLTSNGLVQEYRDYMKSQGQEDMRPDFEITLELGGLLKQRGEFDAKVKEYPDFHNDYLDITQATHRSLLGEAGAGIARATYGTAGTALEYGAFGLDALGADEQAKKVSAYAKTVAAKGQDYAPTIEEMGNVRGIKEGIRYGFGKVGEAVPSIAEGMAAYALGEVVAGAVVPAGLVSIVGRKALASMIERGVVTDMTETALAQTIKAGATQEAKELGVAFVKEGRAIAARMGGPALSAVNAIGLSTGEIYGETGDVKASAIGGVIAGIPDTVLPSYLMGKFTKGAVSEAEKKAIGSFWKRLAHELPVTTTLEAGTEGFQQVVDIAARKYSKGEEPTLNSADWKEIREAMVGGAAGGLIGAPLAAMHAPEAKPGVDTEKLALKISTGVEPSPEEKAFLAAQTPAQLVVLNARAVAIRAEAQAAARRAAATGTPPPPPVVPAGRVSTVPSARPPPSSMTPEQQDARFAVLQRQTARSPEEEAELTVLTTLIDLRPPTTPKTTTTAPVVPAVVTPAVVTPAVVTTGTPGAVVTGTAAAPVGTAPVVAAPVVAAPVTTTTPLVAAPVVTAADPVAPVVTAPVVTAPATTATAPVVTAPAATTAPVEAPFVPTPMNAYTGQAGTLGTVEAIKAAIALVGGKDAFREKVAEYIAYTNKHHPITDTVEPGSVAVMTEHTARDILQQHEAATTAPVVTTAEAPLVSTSLTTSPAAAPVVEPGAQPTTDTTLGGAGVIDVQSNVVGAEPGSSAPAVLEAPKLQAGAVKGDSFIDFMGFALGLKKRGVGQMTEESRNKLASLNWNQVITKMIAMVTNNGTNKLGGFYDKGGSRSTTMTGIAFLMPDGRVILAGMNGKKSIQGVDGKFVTTYPIQRFATQTRNYGTSRQEGSKEAVVTSKTIEPGGKKPATLADVVASGAIPIHSMIFDMVPGEIYQEFANEKEYSRAVAAAEVKVKGVTHNVYSDVEGTEVNQQAAEVTATPESKLAELFTEKPELLETLNKLFLKTGGDEAKMTEGLKGGLGLALEEIGVSVADTAAYLKEAEVTRLALGEGKPAAPGAPLIEGPAAPAPGTAPVQSVKYGNFITGLLEKPKTLLNLFKALGTTNGDFQDAFNKLSEKSQNVILALNGGDIDWKEVGGQVARAFQASGGKEAVFIAELSGKAREVPSSSGVQVDRTAEFNNLVARMRASGYDVQLIEQAGKERGMAYRNTVVLIFNDFTQGGLEKIITLSHEIGHVELDKLGITDPVLHQALEVAVNAAITEVKAAPGMKVATNATFNWEERLVEATAQKLAAAGIPEPSLAGTIWRAVKSAYLRIGMEVMQMFGFTPSPQHVLAWFENHMLRKLGGDYDFRYQDFFRPFVEKTAERVTRFKIVDGQVIADIYDPVTGEMVYAEVLPDSRDAVAWNLARSREVPFTGLAPNGKKSKLTERLWQMVRTPEFKAWFGDWENDPENASKAIHPDTGEPLVMYHGTDSLEKGEMGEPSEELLQKLTERFKGKILGQDIEDKNGNVVGNFHEKVPTGAKGLTMLRAAIAAGETAIRVVDPDNRGKYNYVSMIVEGVESPHFPPGRDTEAFDSEWFVLKSLKGPGVYTTSSSDVAGGYGTFGPDGKGGYANKSLRPGGEGARVMPLMVSVKRPWIDNPEHRQRLLNEVIAFLTDKRDNPDQIKPGSSRDKLAELGHYQDKVWYTDPDGVEHGIESEAIDELDYVNLEKGLYGQLGRTMQLDEGELTPLLRTLGYDGIQHIGGLSARYGGGVPHTVFVAFDPNQVKSKYNQGKWSTTDNRLSYRDIAPKTDEDIGPTESGLRINAAAYGEIIPIIQDAFAKFGGKMTPEQFWATMSRTELPSIIVADGEAQVKGTSSAKIGGEKMTTAMNDQARHLGLKLASNYAKANRMAFARQDEILKREGAKLLTAAKRLSKLVKDSRDSSVIQDVMSTDLVNLLKEVSQGVTRGVDLSARAGELAGAVRLLEDLAADEVIPVEYQNVFKKIMDEGGTPIFEYLSAIAKLNLPLEGLDIADVVKAIQDNGVKDPHLANLATQRPLMVALATLARDSTFEMSLLQLRVLKDSASYIAIRAEQDVIMKANDDTLKALEKKIRDKAEAQTLGDRLASQLIATRRAFNRHNKAVIAAQEMKMRRGHFADLMQQKADNLVRDVGAFPMWDATDGATYQSMQYKDGEWKAVDRTLVMVGDKVAAQHGQISTDLQQNRIWIDAHREAQKGTPLFNQVEHQTSVLGQLDFAKTRVMGQRFWFDAFFTPMAKTFGQLGHISGDLIEKKLIRFQEVMHTTMDKAESLAASTTEAQLDAAKAAGFANPVNFFDEVLNDTIYHIETEHGRDARAGLREAKLAARRRIPAGYTIAADFDAKLEKFLLLHFETSTFFDDVKEKYGVYVDDPGLRDPLGSKAHLQRHSIRYGFGTSGRRLNGSFMRTVVNSMQGAGWHDGLFSSNAELKDPTDKTKTVPNPDYLDARSTIPDPANKGKTLPNPAKTDVAALITKFFTPAVIKEFVVPFVEAPGDERFFGEFRDGSKKKRVGVSQVEVLQAWQEGGGDVLNFIDNLFELTNPKVDNEDGLDQYRADMLRQFAQHYTMVSRIAAKTMQGSSMFDMERKMHPMMDGRKNDLLPPEMYSYVMFTQDNARAIAASIAFHAAFGKEGHDLDAAQSDLREALTIASDNYDKIPEGTRKSKIEFAQKQGWNFKFLEQASKNKGELNAWVTKLKNHVLGQEPTMGDAKWVLELARLNGALVMNQPKSALMNMMNAMDFPLIYKGIGPSARKATYTTVATVARDIFTDFAQLFNSNLTRVIDIQHDAISQPIERKLSNALPLKTQFSDLGPQGSFASGGLGHGATRVMRGIHKVMTKTWRGGINPLGVFSYISKKLDTGIATAYVQTYEHIVGQAIKFFAAHPSARDNPAYRITAADLGMDGGLFSDQGAFEYFMAKNEAYSIGNLEDVARDAAVRVTKGERILDRKQVVRLAIGAQNEVSSQASVNSRPLWLINNPVTRMGGLLLGWPISRMGTIRDVMSTSDGRMTVASISKAMMILGGWTLPAGLAYSLFIDQYDDKLLGKKGLLREFDPIMLTPLAGPLLAVTTGPRGMKNLWAAEERLARIGTFGMAGDLVNSMTNIVDPTSAARDFDLNSRILVFSQFANFRDAIRNLIHQDWESTYASVTRPFLMALGAGGMMQGIQITNKLLQSSGMEPLSSDEAAQTLRSNVGAILRTAGRDIGLSLKAGAGRASPTALSVHVQAMVTAAMSNDRVTFANAYSDAVNVAAKNGEPEPQKVVLAAFKDRNPLLSSFASKPTEREMGKLYAVLSDSEMRAVREATSLFDSYAEHLAPNPWVEHIHEQQRAERRAMMPKTVKQLRQEAANAAMGF